MKAKSKISGYVANCIAAAVLMLTAQISLADSATWLSMPEDSGWGNPSNWTPGGPPNGPSDIATFDQSSQTHVNISMPEEVNSIVFTSDAASYQVSCEFAALIISGTGVTNNSSVSQNFLAANGGRIKFNNASTAGSVSINDESENPAFMYGAGSTIFNDTSNAGGASIYNSGSPGFLIGGQEPGATIFNGTSSAGHAAIRNVGGSYTGGVGAYTAFTNSSTADSASLVADSGVYYAGGGAIDFYDASSAGNAIITANGGPVVSGGAIRFHGPSTGGTARVKVIENGVLDIRDHQSGVTIGSIEGSGNVFLGANNLTVGTNGISTSFSGVISNNGQGGSLAKIGSGILTLQNNDCIADTVGLILVSGSMIKLDFTGLPDVIAFLVVNGIPQPAGIYGGPMSGAPHILPEFAGPGTVSVGADYDFNADYHPDYVLYNASSRRNAIWYLNNSVYLTARYGPTLPPGWVLIDVAKFPGDVHPDYVLSNPMTRQTAIWYLANNFYFRGVYGPTLPSGWQLAAAADFSGDGKPDYVLYNSSTHRTAIWYLNNNAFVSSADGPTIANGYVLAAVADFNRDGKLDYLLFNPGTRRSAIWYLNNNAFVSSAYGPTIASGYVLTGAADFNGNGKPDYVLYKASTGQTAIWYMNDNIYVGSAFGPTLSFGWSPVAP